MCICLCDFFYSIGNFLESNFFQSLLMIVTVLITWYIFKSEQKDRRSKAATIVFLQIKEIKNNVDVALRELGIKEENGVFFEIEGVLKINNILNENSWEKYRQLLVRNLDIEDMDKINSFYEKAINLNMHINLLRESVVDTHKQFYLDSMYRKELSDKENPKIRTTMKYINIILDHFERINEEYNNLPLKELKKIMNKKES